MKRRMRARTRIMFKAIAGIVKIVVLIIVIARIAIAETIIVI